MTTLKNKPTSFEEACANKGLDPIKVLPDVTMFPEKHQKSLLSFAKLLIVVEQVRDNDPDWNDGSERKWYPWFDMEVDDNNPSGFRFYGAFYVYPGSGADGGSRLCLNSEEQVEHMVEHFLEYYRNIFVIEK